MDLSSLVIQILNGISYGLLLFLLASGLSLIFGLMGIVNLAHGSYYMLGAYIGFVIIQKTGNFLIGLLGAGVALALLGILMERFFFRKLYKRELDQVLITFGFAYLFLDVAKWIWGGVPRILPKPSFLEGSVSILGEAFPIYRFAMILMGLMIAISLWLFLEKTRTGNIIRAGVDDKEMVNALGINIQLYFAGIFALGALLAALGGVISGPITGAYPGLDFEILVLALAVVVVGGLGTLEGAFLGSLLIGFAETFGKVLFPDLAMFTIYVTMALVLIFKPSGLLGKEELK
ncbi:amino acid/amide ABC transporter membrane protein 1, HAAT family [Desulfitobacterium dichloroeliminans LMG P-21439]|uniref:Amino acid/amide ABC transporter membrane protein 1, HAAT family n=1 Tax=Desulfitobacterium dichloroeliminans (strain LMG P-21439 / DCA1) TaxID=871963 RepID=L0FBQ4_DESDL|nr:branched-chain amino acid ABC transporter permease [Desulfitobacterium dichloroeliminans]AGA70450.1 amino acid/amide ABC transporter membrane protein 1, HAAT family [Desulfitobacterium dichloroeliminans LMG P-21439]